MAVSDGDTALQWQHTKWLFGLAGILYLAHRARHSQRRNGGQNEQTPTQNKYEMHPLTLQFKRVELELQLRGQQFRASFHSFVVVMFLCTLTHVVMSYHDAQYIILLVIYVPCIVLLLAARVMLQVWLEDGDISEERANELFRWCWLAIVLVACSGHRTIATLGLAPCIGMGETVVYMGTWSIVIILLHIWLLEWQYRLIIDILIFLSLATPQQGFSVLRQPLDTFAVSCSVLVGELLGFGLERMLRTSFLLREQEREQGRAKIRELEVLAQMKDNFVASLSHEMRTPLNGNLGSLQLIPQLLDKLEPSDTVNKIRLYSERALEAGLVLQSLIEDTLDVTRLEQRRARLNVQPLSLPKLAHTCIDLVRPSADNKEIELRVDIDAAVEAAGECMGDPRRLQQVMLNLLNNAVKFSPTQGIVSLRVTKRDQTTVESSRAGALPLLLLVTDTGIGIHPDDRELIFLAYTKATEASSSPSVDQESGTGLGLSICKSIVELHRGCIWVDSVQGEGSTFSISLDLPLAPVLSRSSSSTGDASKALAKDQLRGCHVLVADDVEMNRFVISEMLQALGCIVVHANNGREAVDSVRERIELGAPFDAIFMDLQMPQMDGLQATAAIRALEGDRQHTPIIALTGRAGPEDRERCLVDMDDFLTKPLLQDSVVRTLQYHVRKRPEAGEPDEVFSPAATPATEISPSAVEKPPADAADKAAEAFDFNELLALVGGNIALMRGVLVSFDGPARLRAVDAALRNTNAAELKKQAHAIRGQLLYLFARTAAESALALELQAQAAEPEKNGPWSEEMCQRLTTAVQRLREETERVDATRLQVLGEVH